MRKGLAFVICAPSGAGKTTLTRRLMAEFPNLSFSVSSTTRPPRAGEIEGQDYNFLDEKNFIKLRDENYFAEWAKVHGNYYGTPLHKTCEFLNQGQDVLFDIDVQGAAQLNLSLPHSYFVFCLPPSLEELKRRLISRGTDDAVSIERRLNNAKNEIQQSHWFNSWIVNNNLDKAYENLRASYLAACHQPRLFPQLLTRIMEH